MSISDHGIGIGAPVKNTIQYDHEQSPPMDPEADDDAVAECLYARPIYGSNQSIVAFFFFSFFCQTQKYH